MNKHIYPFRREFIIGLDIGSTCIKLVQLARREQTLTLIRADLAEIRSSGDRASREREILSTLTNLLKEVPFRQSEIAVSFNSPETATRVIVAPPMPKGELMEAVRIESKQYFPFSIEDSLIEFETLGQKQQGEVKKLRLAVAVSPRETVVPLFDLLKKAGVRPSCMVSVSSALQKLIDGSSADPDHVQCFIDIGERATELLICQGGQLIFSRKIPIGGSDFTQAMIGELVTDRGRIHLTVEEAEKIKKEIGIQSPDEPQVILDKISSTQVFSMLRSAAERLAGEIGRCFDYCQEEGGGKQVESLFLFGRSANLKGLREFLSEELGVEVKVGNPLDFIHMQAQLLKPEEGLSPFAPALGAVLTLEKGGVNLLPPEIKEETERALKRASIQSMITGTILIFVFLYVGMRIQLSNYKKRIEVANLELASLGPALEGAKKQMMAYSILAEEPYWEEVFKEIGNLAPHQIYLTEISHKNHRLSIKGLVASRQKETVLSEFILALESGIFKGAKLVTSREAGDASKAEFEIECWMD